MRYYRLKRCVTIACGGGSITSQLLDEENLDEDVDGEEDDKREADHVSEEGGHFDAALFSNAFYHKVGTVADIGQRSEKYGSHADGSHECLTDTCYSCACCNCGS